MSILSKARELYEKQIKPTIGLETSKIKSGIANAQLKAANNLVGWQQFVNQEQARPFVQSLKRTPLDNVKPDSVDYKTRLVNSLIGIGGNITAVPFEGGGQITKGVKEKNLNTLGKGLQKAGTGVITAYGVGAKPGLTAAYTAIPGALTTAASLITGKDIGTALKEGKKTSTEALERAPTIAGLTGVTSPQIEKLAKGLKLIPRLLTKGSLNVAEGFAVNSALDAPITSTIAVDFLTPVAFDLAGVTFKSIGEAKRKLVGTLTDKLGEGVRNKGGMYTTIDKFVNQTRPYRKHIKVEGALMGTEIYKDDKGNYRIRMDPKKAALGMLIMGGVRSLEDISSINSIQKSLPGMEDQIPKQNDLSTLDLPANITRTPEGGVHVEPKYTVNDVASMIKEATNNGIEVPVAKPYEPKIMQGALDRNIVSIEDFFNKQGTAGKAFSDMYKTARYEGDTLAGKATVELEKALKSLSLDERMKFADIAEGKAVADTVPLQRAIDVWDAIRRDVADRASDAGLKIKTSSGDIVDFAPREDYYPHYVPEDVVSNAKVRKDALTKMVKSGWADNLAEAESKFNRFVLSKIKRRYGNLEKAREVDFPIYEKDPAKVLLNYVDSAYHRIAEAKQFGSGDERAYRLANEIALNGGDGNLARSMMDRIFGKEDFSPFSKKVSSTLTGAQTVTKLGVGAVTNVGQSISTSAYTSPIRMVQAMGDALGKNKEEARYFTKLTGEILDSSERDFVGSFGAEGKIPSKFLNKVGFTASEEFNRVVAANAGKREMEYLGNKLLEDPTNKTLLRTIEKFGVNPQDILSRGSVAQEDLIKAAKNVIDNTQFKTQPFDLPYSWSSPMGKVLTQFKSFSYKQTKFMWSLAKNVAKETTKGNLKPLMSALVTFGVLAPTAGEVLGDIKSILKNKKRDDKGLERYLNNVFFTASLGLLEDVGTLATGKYGASGTIGVVAGPTASDAYKMLSAGQSLFRERKTMSGMEEVGARIKPSASMLIKSIPVVGPAIESAVIPNQYTRSLLGVNTQAKTEADRVLEKLEKYPVSEQNKMMEELKAGDKALYNKVYTKKMEEVLKITKDELEIRGLGVENHERALAVIKKLKKMSNSEQIAYIDRLKKLGVVTDSVYKQILEAAQGGALE